MENNTYRLVGVANIWGIYPDFVWCIFEKDGIEYCQDCKIDRNVIDEFSVVNFNPEHKKYIDKNNFKLLGVKEEYKVGDNFVLALQLDYNNYIVGNIKDMVKFLETYDPKSVILKNNLKDIDNDMHLEFLIKGINDFIDNYPTIKEEVTKILKKSN